MRSIMNEYTVNINREEPNCAHVEVTTEQAGAGALELDPIGCFVVGKAREKEKNSSQIHFCCYARGGA